MLIKAVMLILLNLSFAGETYTLNFKGEVTSKEICSLKDRNSCEEVEVEPSLQECYLKVKMLRQGVGLYNVGKAPNRSMGFSTDYATTASALIPGLSDLKQFKIKRRNKDLFKYKNGQKAYYFEGKTLKFIARLKSNPSDISVMYQVSKRQPEYSLAREYFISIRDRNERVIYGCTGMEYIKENFFD